MNLEIKSPNKKKCNFFKQGNCKKSFCLKMYCDCYNNGQFCSAECGCLACHNTNKIDD